MIITLQQYEAFRAMQYTHKRDALFGDPRAFLVDVVPRPVLEQGLVSLNADRVTVRIDDFCTLGYGLDVGLDVLARQVTKARKKLV